MLLAGVFADCDAGCRLHVTLCNFVTSREVVQETCGFAQLCLNDDNSQCLRLPGFASARSQPICDVLSPQTELLASGPPLGVKISQEPYPCLFMTPTKFGHRTPTSAAVRGLQSSQALAA